MLVALVIGAYALSLLPPRAVGPAWALWLLAAAAMTWVLRRPRDRARDDVLPAIAVMISALGLATIARLSPELAHRQELLLGISLALVLGLGFAFDRFRRFAAFKYLWLLGSFALFLGLALFGQERNGARLWIAIGPVEYEPIEIIKLFMVFFMAAYLAETADVIAVAKPWSLRANAKYLGPLCLGWIVSVGILVFERDIGMATLLFAVFVTMLYVATRRIDLIVGAAAIFGAGIAWAAHHYAYVGNRIAIWRSPMEDPLGRGYQALQGLFSIAAGGLFGTGFGLGHPGFIPEVATDYIYAAWSEEFGAIGAIALLAAYLTLVVRTFVAAQRQPGLYAKLLMTGLGATLGFQVVIIAGGVLGLFPLTGITLPFMSAGGSSLVANFVLVALVWAMSGERASAR
jgi:cell division protein FtsW (lipid II flippase)